LEAFLLAMIDKGRKRSTVDRYLYTVGVVHVAAGLPSPSKDPDWPVKWKKLIRSLKSTGGHTRKQAGELDMAGIEAILTTLGDSPRDRRDAALLSLASDSSCRESELVEIRVEHLHYNRRHYGKKPPLQNHSESASASYVARRQEFECARARVSAASRR
jgi:integrase